MPWSSGTMVFNERVFVVHWETFHVQLCDRCIQLIYIISNYINLAYTIANNNKSDVENRNTLGCLDQYTRPQKSFRSVLAPTAAVVIGNDF